MARVRCPALVGVVAEAGAGALKSEVAPFSPGTSSTHNSTGVVFTDGGTGNVVSGNYIGTLPDGATAAGNGTGVSLFSNGNRVGGATAGERNLISNNSSRGIDAIDGDNNSVFEAIGQVGGHPGPAASVFGLAAQRRAPRWAAAG